MIATIYSTDHCPYCEAAKNLLIKRGIEFNVIEMTRSGADRLLLQEQTGRLSFPQIVLNGENIGGFEELRALYSSDMATLGHLG